MKWREQYDRMEGWRVRPDEPHTDDERRIDDFYAFSLDHRTCGGLDGGVEHDRVWMVCECIEDMNMALLGGLERAILALAIRLSKSRRGG